MAGKKKIWFGFLEAGAKGSPVVQDAALATGDPKTVYLFNYMKGRILEYRRDIVEIKLRELESEELAMIPELRKTYTKVRESFEPRAVKPRRVVSRPKPLPTVDDFPEFEGDEGDDSLDAPSPVLLDTDDGGPSTHVLD